MLTVMGGTKYKGQIAKLDRGIDVLVATPGRLYDLMERGVVKLRDVEVLVQMCIRDRRRARRAAGQPERRRRRSGRRRPLQEITSLQAFVEQGHMLPFLLELHGFSLLPILKPVGRYEKCL